MTIQWSVSNDPNSWTPDNRPALSFKFASNDDAQSAAQFFNTILQQRDDLLAALEAILAAEEGMGETDRPHMIQARAAIARAKGEA